MMGTTYGFVFARGGSKGVPRKNIRLLGGKPLLHYAIEAGLAAPSIDRMFVSTEDAEIAEVARAGGAEVIDRPAELATDTASEWLAWRHAVEWVQERYGAFDGFVSLPATCPLRISADVESVLSAFSDTGADVCVAVTPSARSPYFNMVTRDAAGVAQLMITPEQPIVRRQDAPVAYDIACSVYATTPTFIRAAERLWEGSVATAVLPRERAVDIDEEIDFVVAEAILGHRE